MSTTNRYENFFYLPGENDTEIWTRLADDVSNKFRFLSAKTREVVKSLVLYESNKAQNAINLCGRNVTIPIPNAPFPVDQPNAIPKKYKTDPYVQHQLKKYNDFCDVLNSLVDKDYDDPKQAELVEELLFQLQKKLNTHKLVMYNKEFTIREIPLKEPQAKEVVVDARAFCKSNTTGRELRVTWDAVQMQTRGPPKFAKYNVKLFNRNKINVIESDVVSGGRKSFIIKDIYDDDYFYVRVWMVGSDEPTTFQGPFSCPLNESQMMNQKMEDIDTFRMKINGKYKTIYDLFKLIKVKKSENLLQAFEALYAYCDRISKMDLVDWEHMKIPLEWNWLPYEYKVISILRHTIDDRICNGSIIECFDTLYDHEILKRGLYGYVPDPAKGGSQRVAEPGKKRKHTMTTSSTQMAEAFKHAGDYLASNEHLQSLRTGKWYSTFDHLKRFDRVYGYNYAECAFLNTSYEKDACSRLARIERLLRLSKERGYPVLEENVINPHPFRETTDHRRSSTFGPNNYNRTQVFPLVQPAPFVMAGEGDVKMSIFDPQKPYDKTNPNSHASFTDVKVAGVMGKIKYNHPVYPSAKKKRTSIRINAVPKPSGPSSSGPTIFA